MLLCGCCFLSDFFGDLIVSVITVDCVLLLMLEYWNLPSRTDAVMLCVVLLLVLFSRKERLCNGCHVEYQRDLMATSDTETDSELSTSPHPESTDNTLLDHDTLIDPAGSSPQHECSPISDNTLSDQVHTVDDSTLVASNSDAAVSNIDEDDMMSRSAPAANNSAAWSMRDSAYSAMSWVSGVVTRSFVRTTNHMSTDEQPAADNDNVEVSVTAADVYVDTNSVETQSKDVNLTLTADIFSPDVTMSNSQSAGQSVSAPGDSTEAVSACANTTDDVAIQPSLSPDLTTSGEVCQFLQPGDTVERYVY